MKTGIELGPIDRQAREVLAGAPRTWFDLETMTPEKARSLASPPGSSLDLPSDVSVERRRIRGSEGSLGLRIYRPKMISSPGVIFWIRGGGFVTGSEATERLHAPLALATGRPVVSVDYRLAPEHPFPAALEDCFAALSWIAERSEENGDGIALGGESAGGNLAAALALKIAREGIGPRPVAQVLLCPMTARQFPRGSRIEPAVSPIAPPKAIEWLWRQYVGDGRPGLEYYSPLDAKDLSELPRALVITAEYDLLRDEGEAYAERLEQAGVPVTRQRYSGVFHGFVEFHDVINKAKECIDLMAAYFRDAFPGM